MRDEGGRMKETSSGSSSPLLSGTNLPHGVREHHVQLFFGTFGFSRKAAFTGGEFDPGSGRTLAACLRYASRTDPQGLVANG